MFCDAASFIYRNLQGALALNTSKTKWKETAHFSKSLLEKMLPQGLFFHVRLYCISLSLYWILFSSFPGLSHWHTVTKHQLGNCFQLPYLRNFRWLLRERQEYFLVHKDEQGGQTYEIRCVINRLFFHTIKQFWMARLPLHHSSPKHMHNGQLYGPYIKCSVYMAIRLLSSNVEIPNLMMKIGYLYMEKIYAFILNFFQPFQ